MKLYLSLVFLLLSFNFAISQDILEYKEVELIILNMEKIGPVVFIFSVTELWEFISKKY